MTAPAASIPEDCGRTGKRLVNGMSKKTNILTKTLLRIPTSGQKHPRVPSIIIIQKVEFSHSELTVECSKHTGSS